MVALSIGICHVCLGHPQHLFHNGPVSQRRATQLSPILPLAAGDYVVDGGQGELLMGEVTVVHNAIIQSDSQFCQPPTDAARCEPPPAIFSRLRYWFLVVPAPVR